MIRQTIVPFIFSIVILILFLQPMWNSSIVISSDLVSYIEVYEAGTKWISENLEKNESAVLPLGHVFWSLEPSLKNHTKTYSEFWDEEDVDVIHAPEEEREKIRSAFWEHVADNDKKVKFIVASWNDKHMKSTLKMHTKDMRESSFCENISNTLTEVKRFQLEVPSTEWISFLVICEVK